MRNTLGYPRDNAAPLHQRRSSPYLRCARKDGNIPTLQLTRAQHRAFLSRFVLPTLSQIAALCGTENDLRKLDKALFSYGAWEMQHSQAEVCLHGISDATRLGPGFFWTVLSVTTGPSRHLLSREACRSFRSEDHARMIISTPIPMNPSSRNHTAGAVRERHSRKPRPVVFQDFDKKRCWRN